MRIADGSWVEAALERLAETEQMTASARRAYLVERAARLGVGVNTLHRQMVCARWLAARSRLYGVDVTEVRAAYPNIEYLMRLELDRPLQTQNVAKDVLTGRYSGRQLRDIVTATKHFTRKGNWWPTNFQVFILEFMEPLFPSSPHAIAFKADQWSQTGRLLGVDVEMRYDDGKIAAGFISPNVVFAQHQSMRSLWPALIAARAVYDIVGFCTFDDEDIRFIDENRPTSEERLVPLQLPVAMDQNRQTTVTPDAMKPSKRPKRKPEATTKTTRAKR